MTFKDAFPAYIERKLFTLDCDHAIAVYLSFAHGLDQNDQALGNTAILQDRSGALGESAGAVFVWKHAFDVREHEWYVSARAPLLRQSEAVRRCGACRPLAAVTDSSGRRRWLESTGCPLTISRAGLLPHSCLI